MPSTCHAALGRSARRPTVATQPRCRCPPPMKRPALSPAGSTIVPVDVGSPVPGTDPGYGVWCEASADGLDVRVVEYRDDTAVRHSVVTTMPTNGLLSPGPWISTATATLESSIPAAKARASPKRKKEPSIPAVSNPQLVRPVRYDWNGRSISTTSLRQTTSGGDRWPERKMKSEPEEKTG